MPVPSIRMVHSNLKNLNSKNQLRAASYRLEARAKS